MFLHVFIPRNQTRFPWVASIASFIFGFWDATCADVMWKWVRKNKSQIAMELKWTLQVCMWNPRFCQHLGPNVWVGVADIYKRFIMILGLVLAQGVYNWSTQKLKGLVVLMDNVWAPSRAVFGFSSQKIGCKGMQDVVTTMVASCLISVSVEYGSNLYESILFEIFQMSAWSHSFVDM